MSENPLNERSKDDTTARPGDAVSDALGLDPASYWLNRRDGVNAQDDGPQWNLRWGFNGPE